jgi:Ni,Fe-hydrogenase I large subunit
LYFYKLIVQFKIKHLKHFFLLLVIFLFNSCQYFEKQVPSEKELLQKELKSINWKEVDEFPSVVDCEKIENKKQRQQCFFEIMTQLIQQKLSSDTLAILYPELDTIEVKVTIFPNATMKFEPQFPKDSVAYDTVKIDSILRARLVDFPKVNPAIKRGIPVKTQFILPVILKVE